MPIVIIVRAVTELTPFPLVGQRIDSQQRFPALGWLCGGCRGQTDAHTEEERRCGARTDGLD